MNSQYVLSKHLFLIRISMPEFITESSQAEAVLTILAPVPSWLFK